MTTMELWLWTLGSVGVVSAVSLVGVGMLALGRARLERWMFLLVSLAVGALFGSAFLHLLPEAFGQDQQALRPSLLVLSGLGLFFVLEKFLHWQHRHEMDGDHGVRPFGWMILVADGLHNFIDGMLIGAAYLAGLPVGLATTLAVVLHEVPQEIGDYAVLLRAGFSPRRAACLNFALALTAVAGAVAALVAGQQISGLADWLLPVAAGGFIYIAGSDLVPELHRERGPRQSALQLVVIGVGIGLMLSLRGLE